MAEGSGLGGFSDAAHHDVGGDHVGVVDTDSMKKIWAEARKESEG